MFDPWNVVEKHPWVEVRRVHLPPDLSGLTDGRTKIWLARGLSLVEERCTLAHELVHLKDGHEAAQPPAVERSVRERTARMLVHWNDLVKMARFAPSLHECADELDVTPAVLRDRLSTLTPDQEAWLRNLSCMSA